MKKITVIGSINMDISICADTFPKAGETIAGYDFSTQPGGKGANQAITIGKLQGNVSFLGCVGDDDNGNILLNTLTEHSIDITNTLQLSDCSSGTAVIFICNSDNSIIINGGANQKLTPQLVANHASAIAKSDIILSQLEIPTDSVLTAFRIAKENKVTTILNPAPFSPLAEELIHLTDIIILNKTEAESLLQCQIADIKEAKSALSSLLNMGFSTAIITLGSQGCVFSDENKTISYFPARTVTAVDTTGAGDSFCGAFAYALANDFSITEAVQLATLVSSVTVTRRGAALSTPTKEEINTIIKKEGILHELS